MIDAVSTLSVQSAALRSAPQAGIVASDSPVPSIADRGFIASRIRVDNLQNVAILEYISAEGEVIRQYPTEAQIQAFKRAEQAETQHVQQATQQAAHAVYDRQLIRQETEHAAPAPVHVSGGGHSAPAHAAYSASVRAVAASGGGSTQSVVV